MNASIPRAVRAAMGRLGAPCRRFAPILLALSLSAAAVAQTVAVGKESAGGENGPAGDGWRPPAGLTIEYGGIKTEIPFDRMARELPVVTLTVDNPSYEDATRTYEGFLLRDVLGYFPLDQGDTLVFVTQDGYEANLPLEALDGLRAKGLLAYREVGVSGGWELVTAGKEQVNPSPFWLVWAMEEGAREGGAGESLDGEHVLELPWPYQTVGIRLVNLRTEFDRIFPVGVAVNHPVYRGFELFRAQCLRCHSLNLQGGVIGPELNVPMNVTEYRSAEFLKAWIKNPSSFRARNRMPAFESVLTDDEIEAILRYLEWMKDHQVQP